MSTWTQADVDALKLAIKSGIMRVRYDGPPAREMQYQTTKEMRALLAEMEQSVASAAGRKNVKLAATRKGF